MSAVKLIAVALAGAALIAPSAPAGPRPPRTPPQLTVKLLNANGSGCRPDATGPAALASVLPSGAATVRYQRFTVSGSDYKTCVLFASVATPAGWTYLIPSVANQATVTLDASTTATLSTAMWFTGLSWTVRDTKKVMGPLAGPWNTSAVPGQAAWAPCGTSVNLAISETLRLTDGPSSIGRLTATTFGPPQWRRC